MQLKSHDNRFKPQVHLDQCSVSKTCKSFI